MSAVRRGIRPLVAMRDRQEIAASQLDRRRRSQTCYTNHVVKLAGAIYVIKLPLEVERHTELTVATQRESGRHHADDRHRRATHRHRTADEARVTAEDVLPGGVGEYDD